MLKFASENGTGLPWSLLHLRLQCCKLLLANAVSPSLLGSFPGYGNDSWSPNLSGESTMQRLSDELSRVEIQCSTDSKEVPHAQGAAMTGIRQKPMRLSDPLFDRMDSCCEEVRLQCLLDGFCLPGADDFGKWLATHF